MDLEGLLQNIVQLTATFNLQLAIPLCIISLIGEIWVSVPLLLELVWLNVGINLGKGLLSPWHMLGFFAASQVGRQIGALVLYRIAMFGLPALNKFYHWLRLDVLFNKFQTKSGNAVNRINLASPFSIAFARLMAMRIPIAIVLAAKKRPGMLSLGVLISSVIFDGIYISIGAIFGRVLDIPSVYMVLISVGLLAMIYLITFLVKMLLRRRREARQLVDEENGLTTGDKNA
jgi:membrane protein DedA with SNARE-associated domain